MLKLVNKSNNNFKIPVVDLTRLRFSSDDLQFILELYTSKYLLLTLLVPAS